MSCGWVSCHVHEPLLFLRATIFPPPASARGPLSGTLPLPWSLAIYVRSAAPRTNTWGPCLVHTAPQGRRGPTMLFLELYEPSSLARQTSPL